MNIRLAIADSDTEYLKRLSDGLEEYKELNFSVYAEKESLEKALREKRFDVFLFDASVYERGLSLGNTSLAILLLNDSGDIPAGCENFPKIKKYQRISIIYKKILETYADICGHRGVLSEQKQTRIVAFYSPVGGSGKTTMALVAASRLAAMGYKTFYLNLESIASDHCYLPQTGGKGMSDLLGCLGTNVNFGMKLQGLLQTKIENFFYLNHFETPNDIYEMRSDEIGELAASMLGTGLFDFLVIDMDTSIDERALKTFDIADQIVLVEKPDVAAEAKLKIFFKQAHIIQEYGRKMRRILNFDIGKANAGRMDIPQIGKIGMVQNPDAAQLITMLSGSRSSDFVEAFMA